MKLEFCVACNQNNSLVHHHLMPRSIGGTDDETNLITLCRDCHSRIHNRKQDWADSTTLIKKGIESRRLAGFKIGRPAKLNEIDIDKMKSMLNNGESKTSIAKFLKVSRTTIHSLINSEIKATN